MNETQTKHSVLLIDMGGPHNLSEVRSYLQKIFFDPFIIPGNPIKRWLLSQMIASKSAAETRERYALIGGKSNAVENMQKLASQLTQFFADRGTSIVCDVSTRYSTPDISTGLASLLKQEQNPPSDAQYQAQYQAPLTAVYLYPHETAALTGSCEAVLEKAAKKKGITIAHDVRNLARGETYISEWAKGITEAVTTSGTSSEKTFVLMTAHSLPQSIIDAGDEYPAKVEESFHRIKERLDDSLTVELAYQSQEADNWIGPTAEDSAKSAIERGFQNLVVAPLSFIGDNTETLLDIDQDLREAIEPLGFESFVRVAPPDQRGFLCEMVAESLCQEWGLEFGA